MRAPAARDAPWARSCGWTAAAAALWAARVAADTCGGAAGLPAAAAQQALQDDLHDHQPGVSLLQVKQTLNRSLPLSQRPDFFEEDIAPQDAPSLTAAPVLAAKTAADAATERPVLALASSAPARAGASEQAGTGGAAAPHGRSMGLLEGKDSPATGMAKLNQNVQEYLPAAERIFSLVVDGARAAARQAEPKWFGGAESRPAPAHEAPARGPPTAAAQGAAPVPGAMSFFKNARRRDVGAGAEEAPASMLAVAAPDPAGGGEAEAAALQEASAELDPVEAAKLASLGQLSASAQARLRDARQGAVEELSVEEERRRREELDRQEAERAAELEEFERQSALEEKMSGVRAMTRGVRW